MQSEMHCGLFCYLSTPSDMELHCPNNFSQKNEMSITGNKPNSVFESFFV